MLSCAAFSEEKISEEEAAYRESVLREYGSIESVEDYEKKKESPPKSPTDLNGRIDQTIKSLSGAFASERGGLKRPVPIQDSYLSGFMTGEMKGFLGDFLARNPFSVLSRSEIKTLVLARLQGMPFGNLLEDNPKFFNMFVDILRDGKALPSVLGIVNRPDKVKMFGFFALGIFLAAFMLNLTNTKGNILKRIFKKLSIGCLAFACNIGAFYFVFQRELGPTLDIVFRYYHL